MGWKKTSEQSDVTGLKCQVESTCLTQYYEEVRWGELGRERGYGSRVSQAVLIHLGVVARMRTLGPCLEPLTAAQPQAPDWSILVPASIPGHLVQVLGEAVLTIVRAVAL